MFTVVSCRHPWRPRNQNQGWLEYDMHDWLPKIALFVYVPIRQAKPDHLPTWFLLDFAGDKGLVPKRNNKVKSEVFLISRSLSYHPNIIPRNTSSPTGWRAATTTNRVTIGRPFKSSRSSDFETGPTITLEEKEGRGRWLWERWEWNRLRKLTTSNDVPTSPHFGSFFIYRPRFHN